MTVLSVVTLPKLSSIPHDAVQNSFVFGNTIHTPTSAELDAIDTALQSFYNTTHTPGTTPLATSLGASLSTAAGAAKIRHYLIDGHVDGSPHGSPIRTTSWTLGTVAVDQAPDEVALVLSFHSLFSSDVEFAPGARPKSRHRGRVYIGPLSLGSVGADATTKEAVPQAALVNKMVGAATFLLTATSLPWSIWSRKNADVEAVEGGWVDNAFDTQRRRGNDATSRTLFGSQA